MEKVTVDKGEYLEKLRGSEFYQSSEDAAQAQIACEETLRLAEEAIQGRRKSDKNKNEGALKKEHPRCHLLLADTTRQPRLWH